MLNRPLYTISIVSELMAVHPETIRTWERKDLIRPSRRNGRRFYSENDLKQLRFIKMLIAEGMKLPGIKYYLRLYPCWSRDGCPPCMRQSQVALCAKPCWKEEGTYCRVDGDTDACSKCEFYNFSE